jgi:polar amino acid transport system permease protein
MGKFGTDQFFFLVQGLKWTILLACISFLGGAIVGIGVALARTSSIKIFRTLTSAYIAIFQGTPLLMQLFVIYYGVALLNIGTDPWVAVSVAFTAHASAFLGEIWRGSIEAVPKGQTEAAKALGLGYWSRMFDIVLPQAFKISLPATIGFLVTLVKGTSLAAIVGFVELARAGQIISNVIFQPLLVFGIVGIIYFLICWPLSLLGKRLEQSLSEGAR